MKVCSKKDIKVLTGVMAASLLLGGCTATAKPAEPGLKNDPDIKTEINLKEIADTDFDEDEMNSDIKRLRF